MDLSPKCPKCKSEMKKKSGKFGEFWSCSKYPECKGARDIPKEEPPGPPEKLQDDMQIIKVDDWEGNKSILYGVAVAGYHTGVGQAVSKAKYTWGGFFDDELLVLTENMFKKRYGERRFDIIMYVPPTKSGNKVKDFVVKLGDKLGIRVSHNLFKTRKIELQKSFDKIEDKRKNVSGAFACSDLAEISGKIILVFDDIIGSGSTLKEICEYLVKNGAEYVSPFVIAKTYRGM